LQPHTNTCLVRRPLLPERGTAGDLDVLAGLALEIGELAARSRAIKVSLAHPSGVSRVEDTTCLSVSFMKSAIGISPLRLGHICAPSRYVRRPSRMASDFEKPAAITSSISSLRTIQSGGDFPEAHRRRRPYHRKIVRWAGAQPTGPILRRRCRPTRPRPLRVCEEPSSGAVGAEPEPPISGWPSEVRR